MPGSTESEAIENYILPIRETLSCLADVGLAVVDGRRTPMCLRFDTESLAVELRGTQGTLLFSFIQGFGLIGMDDGSWKIQTQEYVYRIHNEKDQPIITYDWHPHVRQRPHLHVRHGSGVLRPGLVGAHFPCGRVSIEELALLLIGEFHVPPVRTDWQQVIAANLEKFERHRTWP